MAERSRGATSAMSGWGQPRLLSGVDQSRAQALVDELVSALVPWSQQTHASRPLAEMALFFAVVSQRREVEVDFSDLIQRSLDSAAATPLPLSLDGLLGWSLTMDEVLRLLGSESDICEASDRCLSESLEVDTPEAELQTDLLRGTAGCLAYLAQRAPSPLIERCRTGLLERFEPQLGQLLTAAAPDLGYAHGLAGVVAVLSDAVESGWGLARERALLGRCVERILASRSPAGGYSFPFADGSGRVAWCNCDVGIAIALLKAGRAMGQPAWVECAGSIALQMARVAPEASGVTDASLCHGEAGAGLMLSLLGQQLQSPEVLSSATRWLNRVGHHRQRHAPLAGFVYNVPSEVGQRDNVSVVQGVSGIGLALEGACGNVVPGEGWLKAFLFV